MLKRKRGIAWLLVVLMAFLIVFSGTPMVSASVVNDNVSITVRDTTGDKGSITNYSGFRNDITNATRTSLLGDSYADIKYSGSAASKLEYQIINNPVTSQIGLPSEDWKEITLSGTTSNEDADVVTDHPGNLNRRSYDVTGLENIGNIPDWENRTKVYEFPFEATKNVSTMTSTTNDAYGNYLDYLKTNGINGRRYYSNTVFGALNGNGDLYPPEDTVTVNKEKAKYQEASKYWGYIKVPTDGDYYLGLMSDDGSTGTITVKDEKGVTVTKKFSDQFYVQSSKWNSNNESVTLKADKYYPVFIEYFNWGGGARFQMFCTKEDGFSYSNVTVNGIKYNVMNKKGNYSVTVGGINYPLINNKISILSKYITVSGTKYIINGTTVTVSGKTYDVVNGFVYIKTGHNTISYTVTEGYINYTATTPSTTTIPTNAIPLDSNWFYPSYNLSPGEYAETTFTGSYGVKLPSVSGDYYVLYKSSKNGLIVQSGCYGPFVVIGNAAVSIGKRAVNTNGSPQSSFIAGSQFNIEYSIRPEPIVATSNFDKASTISLKEVRIEDELNLDFAILKSSDESTLADGTKFLVTDSKITYSLPEIKYNLSSDAKNYIPVKNEYIYTVPVRLNVVGSNMLISKADASKLTFTDPCDNSKVTKNFGNIIMQATPKAPTVVADIINATLLNVNLTATYTDNPSKKEYKIGVDGTWLPYTVPVLATDNATYYFRGGDSVGNYSAETPYTVNNIIVATGISLKLKNGKSDTSVTKLGKFTAVVEYITRATGVPEFILTCPAESKTLFDNLTIKSRSVTDLQGIEYDVSKTSSGIKIESRNTVLKSSTVKKITIVFNVKTPTYRTGINYYTLQMDDSSSSLRVRVVRTPKIY